MMTNHAQMAPEGSMLAEIFYQCVLKLEGTVEIDSAYTELQTLINCTSGELNRELQSKAADLYFAYAEAAFMQGWNLRGNPDLLATLEKEG